MCDCDRLNGRVCAAHCTAPGICQPGDHVDRCLGPLPAPRWALATMWRLGQKVTPEMANLLSAIYRGFS